MNILLGTRVGRLRVIFTLPKQVETIMGPQPTPESWPKGPLVYIEWYTKFDSSANVKNGMMYRIRKASTTAPNPPMIQGAILPLCNIRQSCMLFPIVPPGEDVPTNWTPSNVLDGASSFLVNNWLSKYSYQ